MIGWLYIALSLYLTYYTFMFAWVIWKKEKNMLASLFVSMLAISLTAIPIWLSLRQ